MENIIWDSKDVSKISSKAYGASREESMYIDQLYRLIANILNVCQNGHLFFIGRSGEYAYYILKGALSRMKTWDDKLHLVPFSNKMYPESYSDLTHVQADSIESHLRHHKLDPDSIIRRKCKTCIVDFTWTGSTFDTLTVILEKLCNKNKLDMQGMRSKVETIAIINDLIYARGYHEDTFEKAHYINFFGNGANSFHMINIEYNFWCYCGDYGSKSMTSYTADLWGKSTNVKDPVHGNNEDEWDRDNNRVKGKSLITKYYNLGLSLLGRKKIAKEMGKKISMKYTWFRSLALAIKSNKPIKIHDSVHQVNMKKTKKPKTKYKFYIPKHLKHGTDEYKDYELKKSMILLGYDDSTIKTVIASECTNSYDNDESNSDDNDSDGNDSNESDSYSNDSDESDSDESDSDSNDSDDSANSKLRNGFDLNNLGDYMAYNEYKKHNALLSKKTYIPFNEDNCKKVDNCIG